MPEFWIQDPDQAVQGQCDWCEYLALNTEDSVSGGGVIPHDSDDHVNAGLVNWGHKKEPLRMTCTLAVTTLSDMRPGSDHPQ